MKLYEINFSPTGGTAKVSRIIAGIFNQDSIKIDLTDPTFDFSSVSISEEDICIVSIPAYGGRMPEIAANRLATMKGNGAKTVLIVVLGNHIFEDTLVEMQDMCEARGFVPVAAISAMAEHSYVRKFAVGRPDAEDKAELESFAGDILNAINNYSGVRLELPGNRPYKPLKKFGLPIATEACIKCGLCAEKCPAQAIPVDDPSQTNAELCAFCYRCIVVCPTTARYIEPTQYNFVNSKLSEHAVDRKKNSLYL